jgi:hypothetical protein
VFLGGKARLVLGKELHALAEHVDPLLLLLDLGLERGVEVLLEPHL